MLLIPGRPSRLVSALALGFALSIGAASVARSDEAPSGVGDLVRVDSRNLDHLFVLPGADFSGYRNIMLHPVDVSFSDRWDPNNSNSRTRRRLSDRDVEVIRSNVVTEFGKSFADELSKSGYTLVDHAGDDVLLVTPSIVNLYIAAPSQQQSAGRSRTYVASTGHMTLVADARDSVTGEYLAHAVDTQRGRSTGTLQLATSVSNMGDARRAFTTWARVLRTALDDARKSAVAKAGADQKVATKDSKGAPRQWD